MKIDSLIFDLDGTLWDSSEGIVATWALVLEHYPEIHKKVTAEELASNFGLPLDQIARNMFPEQTEALRMRLMDECCEQENTYGFGQVKAFDAEIHTFEELLDIVE